MFFEYAEYVQVNIQYRKHYKNIWIACSNWNGFQFIENIIIKYCVAHTLNLSHQPTNITSPKVTDDLKAPVEPNDIMVIVISGVGVRAWLTPLEKVQLQ